MSRYTSVIKRNRHFSNTGNTDHLKHITLHYKLRKNTGFAGADASTPSMGCQFLASHFLWSPQALVPRSGSSPADTTHKSHGSIAIFEMQWYPGFADSVSNGHWVQSFQMSFYFHGVVMWELTTCCLKQHRILLFFLNLFLLISRHPWDPHSRSGEQPRPPELHL